MKTIDEILCDLVDVIWALQDYPQYNKEVALLRQIEDAIDDYVTKESDVSEVEARSGV